MHRVIVAVLAALCIAGAASGETRVEVSASSLTSGGTFTATGQALADSPITSVALQFRTGTIGASPNMSIQLQGSFDNTNWSDIGSAVTFGGVSSNTYYIASYAISLPGIGGGATSVGGAPAPWLRIRATNSNCGTCTAIRVAWINFQ